MSGSHDVLAIHGTKLMTLRPSSVFQAAKADIARRLRNSEIGLARGGEFATGAYEPYAFHRNHVRKALDPRDLLVRALMDPVLGLESDKTNTRLLYGNATLLLSAIQMAAE